jgi:phosphopantothenoylcysteine decarboxylase
VPKLSLVVCGAPLASRAADLTTACEAESWSVDVLVTSAAHAWIDSAQPSDQMRRPEEPKSRRPDAVVVCPMTFNTGNKWAAGIADTPILGLLCEALGARKPTVAVPFVNESLWSHAVWALTLQRLEAAGAVLIDPSDGSGAVRPLPSGSGDRVAEAFDPCWVVAALAR